MLRVVRSLNSLKMYAKLNFRNMKTSRIETFKCNKLGYQLLKFYTVSLCCHYQNPELPMLDI